MTSRVSRRCTCSTLPEQNPPPESGIQVVARHGLDARRRRHLIENRPMGRDGMVASGLPHSLDALSEFRTPVSPDVRSLAVDMESPARPSDNDEGPRFGE